MPIEITEIFYPKARPEWRQWLETHHKTKTEIWLRRFKKTTGKPCITYDELVEECLCFGWIDGVVKKLDEESNVQRITPRRKKKTFLSELNRQRVWKLQREGLMTPAGITPIEDQIGSPDDPWDIPDWVEAQLREDEEVWVRGGLGHLPVLPPPLPALENWLDQRMRGAAAGGGAEAAELAY